MSHSKPRCRSVGPWCYQRVNAVNNRLELCPLGTIYRNETHRNELDLHLPVLKMHKWQERIAKMAMHYAICIFDHKHTGRAPFPPKLDAFSKLCIITICIITISTVHAEVQRGSQHNFDLRAFLRSDYWVTIRKVLSVSR